MKSRKKAKKVKQVNTTPIFTKADEFGCTVLDILETSERAACGTKYKNNDIIKGSTFLWEGYQEDALERGLRDVRQDYDAIVIACRHTRFSVASTNNSYKTIK